jgi:hypothetical protein
MFNKIQYLRNFMSFVLYIGYRWGSIEIPRPGNYKDPKVLTGTMLSRFALEAGPVQALSAAEFQVFSQFGDDGIIQYLVHSLRIHERVFVEIGVENYVESNTRFLLVKDKWSGLVVEGNGKCADYIRSDPVTMLFNVCVQQAFVTAENINGIIAGAGIKGPIGLLSIDIDGMDYWIWRAIAVIDPAIVVIEYNALFGDARAITVPYDPGFSRYRADPLRLCYGASLPALQHLASQKGYTFIGCNSNGNNAYFVRDEYAQLPPIASLERKFNPATFSEYSEGGRRLRGVEALNLIRGVTVFNVETDGEEAL